MAGAALFAPAAGAQPAGQAIHLVVPFAPGGAQDVLGRDLAAENDLIGPLRLRGEAADGLLQRVRA